MALCCSALLALSAQAAPIEAAPAQMAPTQAAPTQDAPVADSVRLNLEVLRAADEQPLASGQRVYPMELLYADLIISFEKDFLEQKMVDLWRKPLDLQVELSTPWAEESMHWFASSRPLEEGTSLVVDRDKSFVTRLPDQNDGWVHFHLRQELIVTNVGELKFPAAQLKFAWATRFEDDLVRGAIPLDRQEATIQSEVWKAYTVETPVNGRPSDFMGAVGRYTMELASKLANKQPESANQEMLKVRIAFRGQGYLNPLFSWSPDFGRGFAKRGAFIEMHPDGLTWVGEVQSNHPGTELPSVSWSYFDPTDGGHYQTLRTPGELQGSFPFSSSQLPWIVGGGLLFIIGMLHLQRRRVAAFQESASTSTSISTTSLTSAAAESSAALAAAQPRRATPLPPPLPPPLPTKKSAQLTTAQAAAPGDFIDHLATFLDCRRDQIYADDLQDRLNTAGLPSAFVEELSNAVQVILRARYAGQGTGPSTQILAEIIQRLQSHK